MAKQKTERERMIEQAEELHILPEITGVAPTQGGQHFTALQAAIVRFVDVSQPDTRPEFIHGPLLAAVFSMGERGGRWIRAAEYRMHCLNHVVVIGGTGGTGEADSKGGLWTVVAVDAPAKSAEGIAIQRAALGQPFWHTELPEGVKAIPEGLFKDMRAMSDRSKISLWSNHFHHRASNRRLRHSLRAGYTLAAALLERNVLPRLTQLKAPKLFATAADGEPLALRWRDTAAPLEAEKALDRIDEIVSKRMQRGDWNVAGYKANSLVAGITGTVVAAENRSVTVRDVDGSEVTITMQVSAFRQYVRRITGFDASDLRVVKLVDVGRFVGPETCLFGPVTIPKVTGGVAKEQLRSKIDHEKDPTKRERLVRGLQLGRLWAILAEGVEHNGQLLYPIELTAPEDISQVYAQLAGDGWDRSIQHIALEKQPAKCLRRAGIGFAIDLFHTSHRDESERHYEASRERRQGSNTDAAQAGKKKVKQPQSKPKQEAVTA